MIILGSTREGRLGDKVAEWLNDEVSKIENFEIDFVDLRDLDLPFFNEPQSPAMIKNGEYQNTSQKNWGERVANADAYLIITPEYNHSYSAVLKNALDYVYHEWAKKPVAFVAYGVVGGARAVEHLRGVVAQLQMVSIQEAVHITIYPSPFDEEGKMENQHYSSKLATVLNQTLWWADALKEARSKDYPSANQKAVS
jgi:NAD(P)H-dependent FMN reductase